MQNSINTETKLFLIEECPSPRKLSDFDCPLTARNYLVEKPQRILLWAGEIRDLRDMRSIEDNTKLLDQCFKKLYKTPQPKWEKIHKNHGKQINNQD